MAGFTLEEILAKIADDELLSNIDLRGADMRIGVRPGMESTRMQSFVLLMNVTVINTLRIARTSLRATNHPEQSFGNALL